MACNSKVTLADLWSPLTVTCEMDHIISVPNSCKYHYAHMVSNEGITVQLSWEEDIVTPITKVEVR